MTQATTPATSSKRIHPLVATAAVSIIVVSLVGVAAMTGLLPNSNSTPAPNTLMDNDNAAQALVSAPDATTSAQQNTQGHNQISSHSAKHPTSSNSSAKQKEYDNNPPGNLAQSPTICDTCGVVESVRSVEHQAQQGSGLGAAAGAILGGVLGHQVGNGNGRKLATVAGAVGGGFAGNAIEKRNHTSTTYEVRVHMENGSTRTFTPSSQPDWRSGDRVKIVDGNLTYR